MTNTTSPGILSDEQAEPTAAPAIPTAVFYADPRATVFLLRETISSLLANYGIQHAFVRLSSPPDLVIAQTLVDAGIAYEELEFPGDASVSLAGSAEERDFDLGFDERADRDEPLRAQAAGRFEMSLDQPGKSHAHHRQDHPRGSRRTLWRWPHAIHYLRLDVTYRGCAVHARRGNRIAVCGNPVGPEAQGGKRGLVVRMRGPRN